MLKHNAIKCNGKIYNDLYYGLKSGGSFKDWNNDMIDFVNNLPKSGNKEEDKDQCNKFKGDMFEVFIEIFCNIFKSDEGLGISDYTPILINDDYGMDATGININGHQSAIQVKYRSNPLDEITWGDLAKTQGHAIALGNRDIVNFDHTLFLFTTGKQANVHAKKMLGNRLVTINRGVISTKVRKNKSFWALAYGMIDEKLKS